MNDWMRLVVEVSLRAAVLAACVYAVLALLRIRSAGVRHAAWTAVLCAMLLMPALVRFTPKVEVPVAVELLDSGTPVAAWVVATRPIPSVQNVTAAPAPESAGDAPWRLAISWKQVVTAVYAAGLVWLFASVAWGWRAARAIAGSAEPVALSVPGARVCQSSRVTAPVTMGIWRPRIVLPARWEDWPGDKLRAVLAHEGAHVRRRDALVSLAAQVNRCLFWFHPVAWWLERQLSVAAEHACDEAGVQAAGDSGVYAQVLLDMAEMVRRQGGRLGMGGIGMSGAGGLEERIDRVLQLGARNVVPRGRKMLVGVSCGIAIFAAAACRRSASVAAEVPKEMLTLVVKQEAVLLLSASRTGDPEAASRLAAFRQKLERTENVSVIAAGATPLVSICWTLPNAAGVASDQLFATGKALAERAMKLEPKSTATLQLLSKVREMEAMCETQKLMSVRWKANDGAAQQKLESIRKILEQSTEVPVLLGAATPLVSLPTHAGPAGGVEFAVGKAAVERAVQRDPQSVWARQLMNKIRDQELVVRLPEAVWSGPLESRHQAIQALPEGERFREMALLAVSAGDLGVRAAVIAKDPAAEKARWQEAGRYAAEALAIAPRARDHADYGTAWFTANMAAGVAAALAGDQKAAADYGRKAMDAPPTDALRYPIVNARPWPMNWHFPAQLVAALLRAGERDAAVDILEQYARLTEVDKGRWQADIAVIRKGELPAWAGR